MSTKVIDRRLTIVLDPETGALRGAHEDRVSGFYDGERLLGTSPEGGIPLSPEALAGVFPAAAALAAQVTELQTELAAEREAHGSLKGEKESADARILALTDEVAAAVRLGQEELASAAEKHAQEIASLRRQLETAQAGPAAPAVATCSAVQGRLALRAAGLLSVVEAFIAGLSADDPVRIYWEYATEWRRDDSRIVALAQTFGLSDAATDTLFAEARNAA